MKKYIKVKALPSWNPKWNVKVIFLTSAKRNIGREFEFTIDKEIISKIKKEENCAVKLTFNFD